MGPNYESTSPEVRRVWDSFTQRWCCYREDETWFWDPRELDPALVERVMGTIEDQLKAGMTTIDLSELPEAVKKKFS